MTSKKQAAPLNEAKHPAAQNYFPLLVGLILVVCLSAGLAIGFGSQSLTVIQRWVLIGFLIIFSVFGLAFSLFGATFSEWLTLREWRKLKAIENSGKTAWDVLAPLAQKRRLNNEVKSLAEILDVPAEQMTDLLSAYVVAEDLALRQIQQEEKVPLMRHISVGNAEFDALYVKEEIITCIEVAFLVQPSLPKEKIGYILQRIRTAKQIFSKLRPEAKIKLLVVLVTQLEKKEVELLRANLGKNTFSETPVDVDIRIRDFEELQKIYAG